MRKTLKMSSLVLFVLISLWISFEFFVNVSENVGSLSTDEVDSTEVYETTIEEIIIESTTENASEVLIQETTQKKEYSYQFRNQDYFDQHYEKHGREFGDITKEEYLKLANALFESTEALRKTESDGDLLFYDVESNTFGVLSQDGYIRTCFKPDDGIEYWNRQ